MLLLLYISSLNVYGNLQFLTRVRLNYGTTHYFYSTHKKWLIIGLFWLLTIPVLSIYIKTNKNKSYNLRILNYKLRKMS